jgi:hypothetical protein
MGKLASVVVSLAVGVVTVSAPSVAPGQVLLDESFETNGQGTRYTASQPFNAQGNYWDRGELSDFDLLVPYTSSDGSFFWAAEDVDSQMPGGNGNAIQSIGFNTIDISGATGLEFSGLFACAANDFFGPGFPFHEVDDGITVMYSINGGAFIDALCFSRDAVSNLRHDTGCDGIGDGDLLTADFFGAGNPYGFAIPTGTTLDLRIEVKADDSSEEIAFDSFRVVPEPGGPASLACGAIALALLARRRRVTQDG